MFFRYVSYYGIFRKNSSKKACLWYFFKQDCDVFNYLHQHMKGLFKLLGALFTFQLGAVVAMLFAQKTGKTLRKDLKKSDNPLKVLFQEGLKIDKEILGNVKDWAENSENIQEVRNQIRDVKKHAVDMTDEAKAEMQKNLEKMADSLRWL